MEDAEREYDFVLLGIREIEDVALPRPRTSTPSQRG